MILPDIADYTSTEYSKTQSQQSIVAFKGLDLLPVGSSGEFEAMTNLSARNYPCMSPRLPRTVLNTLNATSFMVFNGVMVWIAANVLYYNGVSKGTLSGTDTDRQLVAFQDRILIFPDKQYYDVTDNVLGSLELSSAQTGLIFSASSLDSELGDSVYYSSVKGTSAYTFNSGDSIIVSGCATDYNNRTASIDHISADKKTLWFTDKAFSSATESGSVTVARKVPDMDYVCVANNRVWGCKGTTIFGSKLGSCENWYFFRDISTDSYSVDVATPGSFTGCHAYGSYVIFLKENFIHKLIGTKPANYQLSTITCPALGLERGSHKSLAYISGILYYLSPMGVVSFSGGSPALVGEKLGTGYTNGVAETDGRRYYISMAKGSAYSLYVYDAFTDLWHREDSTQVSDFGVLSGFVCGLASGSVVKFADASGTEIVSWSGTLCEFTEYACEKKVQSQLRLRAEIPAGSTMKIEIQIDGGDWDTVWEEAGQKRKSEYVSIIPRRCDGYRVRISGTGDSKIYQMDRIFAVSTDME